MFDIYKREPVNKTAALVSAQSNEDDRITLAQEKSFILARLAQIRDPELERTNKENKEIYTLNSRLSQINVIIKERNVQCAREEWFQFYNMVSDEIGERKARELKKKADQIVRAKYK